MNLNMAPGIFGSKAVGLSSECLSTRLEYYSYLNKLFVSPYICCLMSFHFLLFDSAG